MALLSESENAVLLAGAPHPVVAPGWPGFEARRVSRPHRTGAGECDIHSFREIMLVLSGRAEMRLGDEVYVGDAGDLFLFDARIRHDRGYPSGAPVGRHLWFYPLPDTCGGTLVEVAPTGWKALAGYWFREPELLKAFNAAWNACHADNNELNRLRFIHSFALLAVEIAAADRGLRPTRGEMRDRHAEAIGGVLRHLERTFGAGDSIPALARLTGYSRAHFLRLFQRYAGCTVQEYIDRLRHSALGELAGTGLLRKEIADRLGFASSAALSHWERRQRRLG